MLEGAHAVIDNIIDRVAAQLNAHREAGGDDDQFVENLINEFLLAAQNHKPPAGTIHMALSAYRMTIQQEQIKELTQKVSMLEGALKTMWEIEKL